MRSFTFLVFYRLDIKKKVSPYFFPHACLPNVILLYIESKINTQGFTPQVRIKVAHETVGKQFY